VIGTNERAGTGMSARLGAQTRAPMPADIEQRAQFAVLTADDDERFLKEIDREIVAGIGRLAAMPDAMPVPLEQALHVTLEEDGIAIKRPAEGMAGAVGRDCPGNGIDRVSSLLNGLAQLQNPMPTASKPASASVRNENTFCVMTSDGRLTGANVISRAAEGPTPAPKANIA